MKYISHRGNIAGRDPDQENFPLYIEATLKAGYEVEIDAWSIDNGWYLGHDKPTHKVDVHWLLSQRGLWIHCKNTAALDRALDLNLHCFWHQNDDYALTSKGFIWTYPGRPITYHSIIVHPEQTGLYDGAAGICSDYIAKYKDGNW